MAKIERRKSERLLLTIPLRVKGLDATGHDFEGDASTISLSRCGARIRLKHPLKVGQTIRIMNLTTKCTTEFRVVGPTEPYGEAGGEYGVETLDPETDIWRIYFPPVAEKGEEARALLECGKCHRHALLPLSLVEYDVLETSGIVLKLCPLCEAVTPWAYAETTMPVEGTEEEATVSGEVSVVLAADKRQERRVSVQLPVLVRDYYGGTEITSTENVSKSGFSFMSEKNYYVGQRVLVACPYSTAIQNLESHARIVRRQDMESSNRKVYSVCYESRHN